MRVDSDAAGPPRCRDAGGEPLTPSWRRLVVLAVALASLALPATAAAGSDGLTRALERGTLTQAQYALERARSLFQPASVRARFGSVRRVQGFEATGILRELVLHYDELSAADKRASERDSLPARRHSEPE